MIKAFFSYAAHKPTKGDNYANKFLLGSNLSPLHALFVCWRSIFFFLFFFFVFFFQFIRIQQTSIKIRFG